MKEKKESESLSVVSDSLWPHGLYTVHGILQARILEWVDFPFSSPVIEPRSPAWQVDSLPAEPQKKLNSWLLTINESGAWGPHTLILIWVHKRSLKRMCLISEVGIIIFDSSGMPTKIGTDIYLYKVNNIILIKYYIRDCPIVRLLWSSHGLSFFFRLSSHPHKNACTNWYRVPCPINKYCSA